MTPSTETVTYGSSKIGGLQRRLGTIAAGLRRGAKKKPHAALRDRLTRLRQDGLFAKGGGR